MDQQICEGEVGLFPVDTHAVAPTADHERDGLMMPALTARSLLTLPRVLLVALLAPVVLIAAIATIPAFALLPFLHGGAERVVNIISAHTSYAYTILSASRPD